MRSALVVAHPGHELRVYGWLERARPEAYVLTDGSGSGKRSRLPSTSAVLAAAGAPSGALFGRFSDRELYSAIIERPVEVFVGLAEELAAGLVGIRADCVVCDAIDGYNPAHDLCRLVTGAAVTMASRRLGRPIVAYDFPLTGPPDLCPAHLRDHALRIELDDDAFERKQRMASGYGELRGEVEAALESAALDLFRVEHLRPHDPASVERLGDEAPFYERHGARRVAEEVYHAVLTRRHMLPIRDALSRRARRT